ncbi:hypothetical protein [Pseudophaeobacter sp.]|jgi:hypothetical protein|uniref:hypothetical protein n=1 Tax=Pseudophaeobacter sp. TaxID=1971739 RepID=UPI0032D9492A
MISSATHKVGKKTLKLKLSTRALVRLEAEQGGKPFNELLEQILTGAGGVTLVASVLAAGLDDGKGIELDAAYELIDAAGGYRELMPLLSDAVGCAFPELAPASGEAGETDEEAGEASAGKTETPASP